MDSVLRLFDFIFKIEEFSFYFVKNIFSKPPPMPDIIGKLVSNNLEIFYESTPDINTINNYLFGSLAYENRIADEKLSRKAGSISDLSGLSIKALRHILYDNGKIIDARIINWLQLKNKLFILEITSEIPVFRFQFLGRYKTLKTKKHQYFLSIGMIESSVI